jgi:glycosyltransferase involved in cell wall biosynthesis
LKVSVITVGYNCEKTIADTILSVASQTYSDREHIIIDGASTDHTMAIVKKHENKIAHIVSEPDKGMYDAMNKGISLASGDIIGILNADDMYYDNDCIRKVAAAFDRHRVQAVCGDIVYVCPEDPDKIVRYYKAVSFKPYMFAYGTMPPHPGFFVKKACYDAYGLYQTDYEIAADFELVTRFLYTRNISYVCLPEVMVKMRTGGVSTRGIKSNWILNKEIIRACRENNIDTHMGKILLKYPMKFLQLIRRPDVTCRI